MVCGDSASLRMLLKGGSIIAMVPTRTWDVTSGTKKLPLISDFHCVRYINVYLTHPSKTDKNVQVFFGYTIVFYNFKTVNNGLDDMDILNNHKTWYQIPESKLFR